MSWTERMYEGLRKRGLALDPKHFPDGYPGGLDAWRVELDRVYDALEYLMIRRVRRLRDPFWDAPAGPPAALSADALRTAVGLYAAPEART